MTDERRRYEPAPPPFAVGVEVQYIGPETDWTDGSVHLMDIDYGSVGLVVANVPGLEGRPAGAYGPDDTGFEVVHGRSEVAYLRAGPTMVAMEPGRGDVRAADLFRNLEPEGVPTEVVRERLAAWDAERDREAER